MLECLLNFYYCYGFPSFPTFLLLLNTDFDERKMIWYISGQWGFRWALRRQCIVTLPLLSKCNWINVHCCFEMHGHIPRQNNCPRHLGGNLNECGGGDSGPNLGSRAWELAGTRGPYRPAHSMKPTGHDCEGRTRARIFEILISICTWILLLQWNCKKNGLGRSEVPNSFPVPNSGDTAEIDGKLLVTLSPQS